MTEGRTTEGRMTEATETSAPFWTRAGHKQALGLALVLALVVGALGYGLVRPGFDDWRARLEAARSEAAERRAEESRLAAARAAAEAAREAARRASADAGAASTPPPRSVPAGRPAAGAGFDPLAARRGVNPLAPRPEPDNRSNAVPGNPDFGNLPDDEGVDIVYHACTACHSAALFTQQHVTRERWDSLLDWMVAEQGMAPLSPDDRDTVLAYLVRHFGAHQ